MSITRPKRVLFLVNDDRFFWSHRRPLADALLKSGTEVGIATTCGMAAPKIQAAGFSFVPVRFMRGNLNPVLEIPALLDVLRAYRQFRPDLVHQFTFKPILYGSWAAKRTGVRAVINTITGLGYAFVSDGWRRTLLRQVAIFGYRHAFKGNNQRVIFQNADDCSLFVNKGLVPSSRTTVICGSGVDVDRFVPHPEPPGPVTILMASRMLWDKGVGDLAEAARILSQQGLEFQIVLAGAPDPHNPASIPENKLVELQREGLLRWIGQHDDMPRLISASHVVCYPSYYREGLPLALIEAASSGRPVVATDVVGCRDVVIDGESGLLVPPKSPYLLAMALKRLIMDPGLRHSMGNRGRELALERFSLQRVIRQTLDLYEDLLGTPVQV